MSKCGGVRSMSTDDVRTNLFQHTQHTHTHTQIAQLFRLSSAVR